ncbi:MAG: site-specific integrase, partial [Methyloceanibacter sp.]
MAKAAEGPIVVAAPDLQRAVEAWLAYLAVERQFSANTSEAYARDLSQFLAFLAGHLNRLPTIAQLEALAARDIRAFLASRRAQGVGSRSLARTLSALRMFFRFLERRGLGKNDAVRAVALPKLPHSVPKPLTAAKATALVEGAAIAAPDAPDWIIARDTAVLALLYGSGLRISEALSLSRKDAPIRGRDMLRVTGKGDKTRVVPVLPMVREAVERYLALCPMQQGSDDPLFV